ncbi:MAG: LytTR family DNA-binding domain-containing protein [Flavobacteriaceae bacterium]
MTVSCLIIEDDVAQNEANKQSLLQHFPEVTTIQQAHSCKEASEIIGNNQFDFLIVDIHLGDGNIFDLLESLKNLPFKIIFTTSYSDYAIDAFKFSALGYLLKPFTEEAFCKEVKKTIAIVHQEEYHKQMEVFFYNLKNKETSKRIILKNHDLIHVVEMDSILYAQADSNYTHFFCEDRKILVSKSLRTFEDQLVDHHFFRCHHSYLVNLKKIKALHKSGDAIILTDETSVPVASSKKKILYELIS